MSDIHKPLFNKHLLSQRVAGFTLDLTDEQRQVAKNWAKTVADPTFRHEKEKPHQGEFLLQIVGTLLGYTPAIGSLESYSLKAETASKETKGGKTPDGILGFYGKNVDKTRTVIELKSPSANLDLKQYGYGGMTPVEQGFGYVPKFDGCGWVIISNFLTVRLYSSARGLAYCHEWDVSKLSDEKTLKEFIYILHKNRLIADRPGTSPIDKIAKETHTQEEKITDAFYTFYKGARTRLFQQLVGNNPPPEGVERSAYELWLLEKTQKILDRVLFVCFCEDTGLLPYDTIRKAFAAADSSLGFVQTTRWQQMIGLFHAIDKGSPPHEINGYNGGLFAEDKDLNALVVADEVMDDCLKLSGYDFETDLNVNILGHIVENSITDLENIRAEIQGNVIDKKKTKRKRQGIFYTPEYITSFIVENTIGTYLQERFTELQQKYDPESIPDTHHKKKLAAREKLWTDYKNVLQNIKILDPACGSGAFLVAAFDYLHAEYTRANEQLAILHDGQYGLFDLDRQILQQNLFGVDINPESVEITKLSLWLKTANKEKPLNNLDGNIKCGDSTVTPPPDDASVEHIKLFEQLPPKNRTRAFDWRIEFPMVTAQGGFDCIIGNPPYIRQELLAPMKPYWENEYQSYKGTADICIYFIERGLKLLKENGKLGFITSGTLVSADYAVPFRKWLPTIARFEKVVNFGENQPFKDAEMAWPTISILTKSIDNFSFPAFFMYQDIPSSIENAIAEDGVMCDDTVFRREEWRFQSLHVTKLFDQINSTEKKLEDYDEFQIYYGIKTGFNPAFFLDQNQRDELIKEHPEASKIIKKMIAGESIRPWYYTYKNRWLICVPNGMTRECSGHKKESAAWEWFESHFSSVADHLKNFEHKARKRTDKGEFWWELRPCDYYSSFNVPKVFWPEIAKLPRFSLDTENVYINNSAYIMPVKSMWVLSILRSRVAWFFISQISIPLRLRAGLWQYKCFAQFIKRIPIPTLSEVDKKTLEDLAIRATDVAKNRSHLHETVRCRIKTDLGGGSRKLNTKLNAWYTLKVSDFCNETKKHFKTDIPLKERTEWELALTDWQQEHILLTEKLIIIENEINDRVYNLYGLSKSDIELLEDHMEKTKTFYPLGEV
ncbi:MAG: N-6 DNA methylase [Proteobacteria bacterium]|nr:N-6 DNA methylase [Pseudomonadota bacterium]